jgi:hypothetical protein
MNPITKADLLNFVEGLFQSKEDKDTSVLIDIFNDYCDHCNLIEDRIYDHFNDNVELVIKTDDISFVLRALINRRFDRSIKYAHFDINGHICSIQDPLSYIKLEKESLMDYLYGRSLEELSNQFGNYLGEQYE